MRECHHVLCLYAITGTKITAITCSALPAVGNGTIIYNYTTTPFYDYETTAVYECDTGYEVTSGDRVRTCTGDGSSSVGQWNGTAAFCLGTTVYIYVVMYYLMPIVMQCCLYS